MAKGNMLLGQAIGSVGDITFSRNNGKQIIKAKPSQVKNPQTKAQMIQRVLLNTISQAYSKMADICDHSFEGVPAGQQSMSYFMTRNLKLIRYTLSVVGDLDASNPLCCPVGSNGLASNPYVIAKGSLSEIIPIVGSGAVSLALSENTYQAVLDATGMKRGDQLTIVTVSGSDITTQKFHYSRIILDPVNETGESLPLSTAFVNANGIVSPNPRNENTGHTYAFTSSEFDVSVSGQVINMGACIASRQKEDGSWLRSNATLLLADGASVGYNMQECLDLFAAGGIEVESSRYLNNALRNAGGTTAALNAQVFKLQSGTAVGTTTKNIVGIETAMNGEHQVVKLVDEDGNKYFLKNFDDDTTAYGKFMTNKAGANMSAMFQLANIGEGPTDANTLCLEPYANHATATGNGPAQVAWLVSKGCNYQGFFVQ